jgi:hypothetical protein
MSMWNAPSDFDYYEEIGQHGGIPAHAEKHRFPCVDAQTCSKCLAHQRYLDDAMETLMAEKGMFWCVFCKAQGIKKLAGEQFRGKHYCEDCMPAAHQETLDHGRAQELEADIQRDEDYRRARRV